MHGLGLGQDAAAAYVIAAGLDGLTLDQIDAAAQERFQRLLEIGVRGQSGRSVAPA